MPTIQRIIARTHPTLKKGFAQVEVIGSDLPDADVTLSLSRTDRGAREYLVRTQAGDGTAHAWQTDNGAVTPDEVGGGGDRLFITLGKGVVAHLDQQSIYAVALRHRDVPIGQERAIPWRDVAPVEATERMQILSGQRKAAPPSSPPPPPPPPPEEPGATPEPPPVGSVDPPPPPRTGRPPWLLALPLILLLAVAGGWYVVATSGTPPQPEPSKPPLSREAVLGAILEKPPEEMLKEAQTRRERSDIDEAVLLLRAAADKGSAEALRQLGQIFDPTNQSPGRTTQARDPSAETAYGYYRRAFAKGSAPAREDLARLRLTVERRAGQGDAEAARLLNRWVE